MNSITSPALQECCRRLRIIEDVNGENPRQRSSNLGVLLCFSHRYRLGDDPRRVGVDYSANLTLDRLRICIQEQLNGIGLLPVYLLDRSGVSVSTAPFQDCMSEQTGFIFTTVERLAAHSVADKDFPIDLSQQLAREVDDYNAYLSGQCVGYVVEEQRLNDNYLAWSEIRSSWAILYRSPDDAIDCIWKDVANFGFSREYVAERFSSIEN